MTHDAPSPTASRAAPWRGWGRDLAVAFGFLTRFPVPVRGGHGTEAVARASRAFAVVGLVVGLVAGGGLWLAAQLGLHPLACAFVGLALGAVVTGALHEDGLADVADGFAAASGASTSSRSCVTRRSGATAPWRCSSPSALG